MSHEKRYQALSHSTVLEVTESWVGPGDKATYSDHFESYSTIYWWKNVVPRWWSVLVYRSMVFPLNWWLAYIATTNPAGYLILRLIGHYLVMTLTWLIEAVANFEFMSWLYLNLVHKPSHHSVLVANSMWKWMGWDKPEQTPYLCIVYGTISLCVYIYNVQSCFCMPIVKNFCAHWVGSVDCTMPHALASAWDFLHCWHTWWLKFSD